MSKRSSGGKGRTGSARGRMTPTAAARVQSAGARNSGGRTARSGFASRAQSTAAKGSPRGEQSGQG